ncbi:DMT family transporter [Bacillus cytotoxicus]|uniref:SugE protein n=1 Tax=Bacillus cytotoxicus TaxID=580165 RepID=A0AAX2CL28_9BACI|nr:MULTISPECIES: multidrug efflux SMR transporter [Bacillus cereus group]AWC29788.1 QacE family quaternary ammonium compound efflux SMR transporter [Bacillus cytotoxicus]AWC33793.1 QacE family quaternary ammonium compound efflux SMR transporter [Bacillus cytotoxicus]AWC37773.1 QacE family quaternary ammonium compound efflux SMR transporter [Bacillus cytotoxicus]AWC41919.1 QacE family quaternary ammonium compound efflux SMR transporter [Bacillus cytotoxicus]AWC45765.1 QacE family quaternary amm
MAWVFLILAGICEVTGVLFMKIATKKKGWLPKLILIANFGISFFFLSLAMNVLPMGTAYAIWTGIGTAGSALLGILIFHESADWRRLVFLSCIVCGAIGLKLLS